MLATSVVTAGAPSIDNALSRLRQCPVAARATIYRRHWSQTVRQLLADFWAESRPSRPGLPRHRMNAILAATARLPGHPRSEPGRERSQETGPRPWTPHRAREGRQQGGQADHGPQSQVFAFAKPCSLETASSSDMNGKTSRLDPGVQFHTLNPLASIPGRILLIRPWISRKVPFSCMAWL